MLLCHRQFDRGESVSDRAVAGGAGHCSLTGRRRNSRDGCRGRLGAGLPSETPLRGGEGPRTLRPVAQSAVVVHAGGNLAAEVASFVGRRRELADAKRALSKSRLVTLTGVGGVGKTRVAERVARDRRRAYPHGVWLVELAELPDPALLTQTVLTALGVRGQPSGDGLEALIDFLTSRHLLLVLDNCEHLLDEVAALSAALLRRCPDLQILATSREPLRVVGEAVLPVPPMAAPEPERSGGVAGLSRYDAVALFTERAAAAVPDFALTEDNYRAVAALCYRLDGLPLAIELAAGRLRSLSPAQILSKLDDRYALLTGGERGRPDRQQTLRASIEWSYQLCTRQEQRLWARLCVFAGSFELDAVEGVCTGDIAGDEIVDLVSGLVDKSIVVRHERGTVARYRLLETLREFGLERLNEAGDGPALRMRHLQWYAALIHTAKAEWISERQVYWLARLAAESANVRSALDFCLNEHGDADAVMEIMVGIPLGVWWAHGKLGEGRYWLDEALARSSGVTVLRVRALLCNSMLAMVGGEAATGNRLLGEARRVDSTGERSDGADPVASCRRLLGTLRGRPTPGDFRARAGVSDVQRWDRPGLLSRRFAVACLLRILGRPARAVKGVLRGDYSADRTARGIFAPGERTDGFGLGCVAQG
jgi:predicted ATPase